MKLYQPYVYNSFSFCKKTCVKIKDILHLNRSDQYLLEIFESITTTDEISKTLNEVTVFYPSELLKNGIVIVDTPGTDSLNPSHAEITRRAIKEICDLAIVIIPAIKALPLSFVDYLEANLGDVANKCIYFITKIELVRRSIERMNLQKGVKQRITNYLGVENPQIVLAPTLVSLEEKGVVERAPFTTHLTEEDRHELCSNYEADLKRMIEQIHSEREQTINDRIRKLTTSLHEELQKDITSKNNELQEELEQTKIMRVKPLKDFMNEFYSSHEVCQYSYVESVISNSISKNKSKFKTFVFESIDDCTTKDATQSTMEDPSVVSEGNRRFQCCYQDFKRVLSRMLSSYTENFNEFRALFTEEFSIDAVDFTYTVLNNPDWQREYEFEYDKSNLTTFLPFRLFKSLASIKEQMKSDVGPKIDWEFDNMEKYYISYAEMSYKDIEKQMDKVKGIFIEKYEKIIADRIKESDKKEQLLNKQLVQLKSNLDRLNNLEF